MPDRREKRNDYPEMLAAFEYIKIQIADLKSDSKEIKNKVDDICDDVERKYVSKTEFDPIKRLVYGAVSLILVAVIGAVIGLVVLR